MSHLRLKRFEQGLTVLKLAEMSGVSRQQIARLEDGGMPTAPTALALSQALKVPLTELWPSLGPQPTVPTEDAA